MFFSAALLFFLQGEKNILTLRRLRGGVKIRASEFLGGGEASWGGEVSKHHCRLSTPRDRFALAPPPASGGG